MKWKIPNQYANLTVRDYLLHVRSFSNRLLKDVKDRGKITVNEEEVNVRVYLKPKDLLEVQFPEETRSEAILPMPMEIEKVYEDRFILVISKRSGMAVLPNPNDLDTPTLANAVMYDYKKRDIQKAFHIVTRLDRNTSGLVLIAKDRYTHHLFQQTEIKRNYLAIVEGHLDENEGVIDLPIGRNLPSIIERKVLNTGKRAITHFRVIEKMRDCSLVNIQLETGRTHQIRVHFSHLGHPLIGDDLYGGSTKKLNRQALHCHSLKFIHPYTQVPINFYSHLPKDLQLD